MAGMFEFSGKVLVVFGIIMAVGSFMMNRYLNTQKFTLFMIFGAILIIFGFLKSNRSDKKPKQHQAQHKHAQPEKPKNNLAEKYSPFQAGQDRAGPNFCSHCRHPLAPESRFCPNCGARIR